MPHRPVTFLVPFVVTHPFHPLRGQRLEVLFVKRRGPAVVFVCSGGVGGQITLPGSWTDRGEPPSAWLSAEGLAGLDTLVRAIRVVDCGG